MSLSDDDITTGARPRRDRPTAGPTARPVCTTVARMAAPTVGRMAVPMAACRGSGRWRCRRHAGRARRWRGWWGRRRRGWRCGRRCRWWCRRRCRWWGRRWRRQLMLVGDHQEATGSADASPAGRVPDRRPEPRPTLGRCIGIPTAEFAERLLGHGAAAHARPRPAPRTSPTCSPPTAVDELISARGLRTPFLRMAKNGSVLATSTFTRSGGVRRRHRRSGRRRQGARPVGRRRHPGAPGAAPHLAAADPVRQRTGRRTRSPGADQRLHHPAREPGLRRPLRHPRRLRPAGRGQQAVDHPPRRSSTTRCRTRPGSSARPQVAARASRGSR